MNGKITSNFFHAKGEPMRIFSLLKIAPTNDFLQVSEATSRELGRLHIELGECYTLKANHEQIMAAAKTAQESKKLLKSVYEQRVSKHEETLSDLNRQIKGIEKKINDIHEAIERYNRQPMTPSALEAVSRLQKHFAELDLIRNPGALGETVSARPAAERQAQDVLPDVHRPRRRSENPSSDTHAAPIRTLSQPVSARARVEHASQETPRHRIPHLPRADNAPRSGFSYRAPHEQAISPASHYPIGAARDAFFTRTPHTSQEQAATPVIHRAMRGA